MTLYHGATVRVEHPLCDFGRPDMDFGRGFYLTNLKEQAEEWAARLSEHQPNNQICILNQGVIEKYISFKEVIEL